MEAQYEPLRAVQEAAKQEMTDHYGWVQRLRLSGTGADHRVIPFRQCA